MPRQKVSLKPDALDFLKKNELDVPKFSTGTVAEILGLQVWRLQKFLDSPQYQLSASGQLGEGKGSRRWFTTEDVYRIGIAAFLAKDGFNPKLIAQILQSFGDRDLLDFDEHGEVRYGIKLIRTKKGPRLDTFRSGHPPDLKPGGDVYYVLDLGVITVEIDRRIEELAKMKAGR
jgi:DNA-binding transcriptional MerR regulator